MTPKHPTHPSDAPLVWAQCRSQGRCQTHILYDQATITEPQKDWLSDAHWRDNNKVLAELGGRGSALLVQLEGLDGPIEAVLRRYRRGGFVARLSQDRYFYLGLEKTRSVREMRLLSTLHALGLRVPRPLWASVERVGLWTYRQTLMTQAIPKTKPLAHAVNEMGTADWDRLAKALALCLDAGVYHPDLNANNVLVDRDHQMWLIDFDRASLGATPRPGRRMVARLCASFAKLGVSVPIEQAAFFEQISAHRLGHGQGHR